jgi:tRNA modification GTPase
MQEGLKTVIAGKPNVGKSSLYNLLLNEDRAIVTALPGTTRDILIDFINIKGIPLRLMDTAGLRRHGDTVEQIGMEYARRAIDSGDMILFMVDLAAGIEREDMWIYESLPRERGQTLLVVGNKVDLPRLVTKEALASFFPGDEVVEISAMTGDGIEDLEEAIVRQAFSGEAGGAEGALVLAARQALLLDELVSCLDDGAASLANDYPLDVVAIDLQLAYSKLQNLLGNELPDDLLDHIFRNFCIGK